MAQALHCDRCNKKHDKCGHDGLANQTLILECGSGHDTLHICCLPKEELDPSQEWTSITVDAAFQKYIAICAQPEPEFALPADTLALVKRASYDFTPNGFSDADLADLKTGLRASGHPIFQREKFELGSFKKEVDNYRFTVSFKEFCPFRQEFGDTLVFMGCRADGTIRFGGF
jgi:hypothetical protein